MNRDPLIDFELKRHGIELMEKFAKKLQYDNDQIESVKEIANSIKAILQNHDVRTKSQKWDKEGTKLVDGKVVLPKGMEEVLFEIIKDNEFYNVFIPEKLGGMGFTAIMLGPMLDILTQYDLSLQILTTISISVLEPLISNYKPQFDNTIQNFAKGNTTGYVAFTEPGAGSNLENVKSTSVLDGDEWILNGNKIFISNGGYADTGLFLAQNIEDGKSNGTNVFLVEGLNNIDILRLEEKSGIHANPTTQLQFDNVRVPKENVIGKIGDGYRKVLERLMGMRLGVAFQAVSTAKRGYELAFEYANTREQYGKAIINFPEVSAKLKAMQHQIPRMEDYAYRAAYSIDRHARSWIPTDVGAGGKNITEKVASKMLPSPVREGIAHYYASSAKIYCTEIANSLLYDAQQVFGGMGFVAETEINKIARDARVLSIYEGTSEIHSWAINRARKAVGMIPRFKYPYQQYEDMTVYETMLFARFPHLKELI